MELENFLNTYTATDTIPAPGELIEKYKDLVPESLLNLWKTHGFGKYNNGLIEVINPEDYRETLEMWLGRKVDNYVPLLIGAFGDFFYYRKITDTDEDVCVLDPHFKKVHNIVWSLNDFFNAFLTDDEIISRNLMNGMFNKAVHKLGKPERNEIFTFTPALALGGSGNIESVGKGNAVAHLSILFQL